MSAELSGAPENIGETADNKAPSTVASTDSKETLIKKPRERSIRYPFYSLEDCVQYLSIIHTIGGRKGAQVGSVLSQMKITSTANRRFSYLTSSSELFGLLVKEGDLIKPTDLGIFILYPPNGEEQKKQLLISAFMTPTLYLELIKKFNENILPNRDMLRSVFYNMNIAQNVLNDAVDSFINSAKYVRVLDENNRLVVPLNAEAIEIIPQNNGEKLSLDKSNTSMNERTPSQTSNSPKANERMMDTVDLVRFEVLTSSGKKAVICLPSNCTQDDIDKIKKIVTAYGPT